MAQGRREGRGCVGETGGAFWSGVRAGEKVGPATELECLGEAPGMDRGGK